MHLNHSSYMDAADSLLPLRRRRAVDIADEIGEITVINREWSVNHFDTVPYQLYVGVCQHAYKVRSQATGSSI